jgi:Zn-dependent M28 family amino/carboxypeptidase
MPKTRLFTGAVVVAASMSLASPAFAATGIDTQPLRDAVTVSGIREHLAALEAIAKGNVFEGVPTRATGTPGHVASVNYVVQKMTAAGYNVSLQQFEADIFFEQAPAVFAQVAPNAITYPRYDGQTGVWYTADFSGDGDVTAAAVVVDFTEPTTQASASSSGCEASDFGPEVVGKIVLLQRGTCDFGLKAQNASAANAAGAVIFNEGTIGAPDRNDVLIPTLAGYNVTIPVVGTDYATGRSLVDLANGAGVTLRVKVDGFVNEGVLTNNVIAETPGGRSDRTVVVGAHLDSVYQGPGINDDGSGTATLLETAEQMTALGITPRNKVRFIFFSGEEQGLLGSEYYVSQLTKTQLKDISVMLDFDMLASPNYARFIYDGNGDEQGFAGPNGSGTVEQVFKDFWDSQGLAYETIPFDGRSDYDAFTTAGIPAGGIFAGAENVKEPYQVPLYGGTAGVAFDKCYHQLCDNLTNINDQGLSEHSDAAVHAILTFAQTTSAVNGTDKGSASSTKPYDWKGNHQLR